MHVLTQPRRRARLRRAQDRDPEAWTVYNPEHTKALEDAVAAGNSTAELVGACCAARATRVRWQGVRGRSVASARTLAHYRGRRPSAAEPPLLPPPQPAMPSMSWTWRT